MAHERCPSHSAAYDINSWHKHGIRQACRVISSQSQSFWSQILACRVPRIYDSSGWQCADPYIGMSAHLQVVQHSFKIISKGAEPPCVSLSCVCYSSCCSCCSLTCSSCGWYFRQGIQSLRYAVLCNLQSMRGFIGACCPAYQCAPAYKYVCTVGCTLKATAPMEMHLGSGLQLDCLMLRVLNGDFLGRPMQDNGPVFLQHTHDSFDTGPCQLPKRVG